MLRFCEGLGWWVIGTAAWCAGWAYVAVVTAKDAITLEIEIE